MLSSSCLVVTGQRLMVLLSYRQAAMCRTFRHTEMTRIHKECCSTCALSDRVAVLAATVCVVSHPMLIKYSLSMSWQTLPNYSHGVAVLLSSRCRHNGVSKKWSLLLKQ
jgi:hypothetical protein